jgi:hypothetical protein
MNWKGLVEDCLFETAILMCERMRSKNCLQPMEKLKTFVILFPGEEYVF